MTLQPCRECGESISTDAVDCPRCGASRPTGQSARVGRANDVAFLLFVLILAAVMMAFCS